MYFIDAIRMLCPLSAESERRLVEVTTPCRFPKRYQLVRDGEFCHSAYFLEQGMTRSFWVVDGEEVTTSFSSEGGIVFSMDELYYGRRSEEVVETLEETSARRIALDDLRTLFRTNLELANWGAHHPPERVPAAPPFAQGAPHAPGRGALRGLLPSVSRRLPTGPAGLHRLLPGHLALDAEPAAGKKGEARCRNLTQRKFYSPAAP